MPSRGTRKYKLADKDGLYLLVTPPGGKLWRLKFRNEGKERKLAIGSYKDVSLGEARAKADEARKLLARGIDPAREKQREKVRANLAVAPTIHYTRSGRPAVSIRRVFAPRLVRSQTPRPG